MPPIPVTLGVVSTGEVELSVCFFWSSILSVFLAHGLQPVRTAAIEIVIISLIIYMSLHFCLRAAIGTVLLEHYFEHNPDNFDSKFENLRQEIERENNLVKRVSFFIRQRRKIFTLSFKFLSRHVNTLLRLSIFFKII